jgi:hypothetical protein
MLSNQIIPLKKCGFLENEIPSRIGLSVIYSESFSPNVTIFEILYVVLNPIIR